MLHARIVEAIETLGGDRLAEQVERLAHHAFRGEVWDKALMYFRQAGQKAMAQSAYREAVTFFEQALEALGHLQASRELQKQAIDLRFDLRNVLFPLGKHERLLEHLRDAQSLAESLGDHRRLGQIFTSIAQHFNSIGDYENAITSCQNAFFPG